VIAKGKVIVSHEKLKELFNLPDEVEFISIHDMSDGIEFNIASKHPIGLLTREVKNWENMRRQRVPREKISYQPVKTVSYFCECGLNYGTRNVPHIGSTVCVNCMKPRMDVLT
jgi:hypothetical protein